MDEILTQKQINGNDEIEKIPDIFQDIPTISFALFSTFFYINDLTRNFKFPRWINWGKKTVFSTGHLWE